MVGNRFSESRTDVDPFVHHVVLYSAGTGSVRDNVFDGCGHGDCVLAVRGSDVEVAGNAITVYGEHVTRHVIIGSDGSGGTLMLPPPTLVVADNVITGVGAGPSGYAVVHTGIQAEWGTTLTAYRNTLTNVANGIAGFGGGVVADARDNVVDHVRFGIGIWGGSRVTARFNDITDVGLWPIDIPDSDPALSDLTCNWWGDPGGPENPTGIPPSLFTPWATAPVAGTPATSCSGGS